MNHIFEGFMWMCAVVVCVVVFGSFSSCTPCYAMDSGYSMKRMRWCGPDQERHS